MNYLEFFGLNMEPFSNVAIGKFYYNSPRHAKALTKLTYAVDSRKGLALLVGAIGAGKTTLARRFLDSLPENEYEAALIVMVHSSVTADWILRKIALQMGVEEPSPDKLKLIGQLYERLVAIHEGGKKAVVLIDEAQMLQTREIMEEFRGLLNFEHEGGKLITFVFFGLQEIVQNLKLDEPLAQRVAMRINLEAMNLDETEAYILHRLNVSGNNSIPFSKAAMAAVYENSKGIPRLINTICDNALLEAFLLKKKEIDEDLVNSVLEDLRLEGEAAQVAGVLEDIKLPEESGAAAPETGKDVVDEVDLMFQNLESK